MAKTAAKDMFCIGNWRGYISIPHVSGGQACSATPQAPRNDWWSLPSSSMASLCMTCILSLCDCCRVLAWFTQVACASLIAAVHIPSTSQIAVVQWALASLMALAVWASFWWKVALVSDTCFLWWASMDALFVSSHLMALFISPCSQSTSLERAFKSGPGWVLDGGAVGTLATLGVSDARVGEGEWLFGIVLSNVSAHGDAYWEVASGLGVTKTVLSKPV